MVCKNCGFTFEDGASFCPNCGATAVPPVDNTVNSQDLPEQYRPLGAWTYFWLQILFAIPVVGLVFLIIFSINDSNINRRNFARSYWCVLAVVAILTITIAVIYATVIGAYIAAY